jgi:hypothetical protein
VRILTKTKENEENTLLLHAEAENTASFADGHEKGGATGLLAAYLLRRQEVDKAETKGLRTEQPSSSISEA